MLERYWPWLPFLLALVVLVPSPAADLWAAGLFHDDERGFFWAGAPPVKLIYHGTAQIIILIGVGNILLLALSYLPPAARRWPRLLRERGVLWFLILGLILGPGIITHSIFKNQWGRPRPIQIAEFGGQGYYVPPFVPSKQCRTNCSFYSGHAAAGFYLMAVGFVARRKRRWLVVGILAGGAVGVVRMIQGAHFLSDVIFCGYAIWAWSWLLYQLMLRWGWLQPPEQLRGPLPAR